MLHGYLGEKQQTRSTPEAPPPDGRKVSQGPINFISLWSSSYTFDLVESSSNRISVGFLAA